MNTQQISHFIAKNNKLMNQRSNVIKIIFVADGLMIRIFIAKAFWDDLHVW